MTFEQQEFVSLFDREQQRLEKIWADARCPVWVVRLELKSRKAGQPGSIQKIVRARTKEGAISTAVNNTFVYKLSPYGRQARLADPERDLGCVRSTNGETDETKI